MSDLRAPVIIEGAMKEEIGSVISALENVQSSILYGFPVFQGTIEGYPVIAARTKIGMINAAMLTLALTERFNPCCIISQGTAGSHLTSLHPGDIVLGEKIVSINCAHMVPEDCRSMEQVSHGEWQEHRCFESEPVLLSYAEKTPYTGGRLVRGCIGSGDYWSHGNDEISTISARYGTFCEEMETFAAAQVCSITGTRFLALRVISNNELTGESFDPDTAEKCQSYVLDVVRNIISARK